MEDWMLSKGPAKKVCIYVNEDTRHNMVPLYESILSFLIHKGVAGATAYNAMAGFGAHQIMHTAQVELLSEHLPIRIEFMESAAKVEDILPTLYEMVTDGVIEVQDTQVIKVARQEGKAEAKLPHEKKCGKAKLLRVYLGEADRWHDQPLYDAIVKRLHMMDISGATVYRGIMGYGMKGHTHKQGRFRLSRDLPIMIAVIDGEEKITQGAEAIEAMVEDGLIVISDVDFTRLVRQPPAGAPTDANLPTR
jgi:PII-like signaling protein